jgi:hypothetical protein
MASNKAGEDHLGPLPGNIPPQTEQQQMASTKRLKKDLLGQFPDPMIVWPLLEHRQTIIILHGRGSFAAKFGPPQILS